MGHNLAPEGTKSTKEPLPSEALRTHTVSTRLSGEELRQLTAIAGERGNAEVIRELILAAIARNANAKTPDPVLSEIVGVRLLLVNLLRPRDPHDPLTKENFEMLLDEIKRVKKQVAIEIQQDDWKR
jgi:hypothetical protein